MLDVVNAAPARGLSSQFCEQSSPNSALILHRLRLISGSPEATIKSVPLGRTYIHPGTLARPSAHFVDLKVWRPVSGEERYSKLDRRWQRSYSKFVGHQSSVEATGPLLPPCEATNLCKFLRENYTLGSVSSNHLGVNGHDFGVEGVGDHS